MEALIDYSISKNYQPQKLLVASTKRELPILVMITSYPPRECGIATYANDLYNSLFNKFNQSFDVQICALELEKANHSYAKEVKYVLETNNLKEYTELAQKLNNDENISLVLIQHEFGFFSGNDESFLGLLKELSKPIIFALHTVLGKPNHASKEYMQLMLSNSIKTIVMTKNASVILNEDYKIDKSNISIISHGTHLVKHIDKTQLKNKYGLQGRKILSTFGLLNSGKSIETTLYALANIIKNEPTVLFLIIGITHPGVVKKEGEIYRESLQDKIKQLHLENNVLFINQFLELPELLEYLQLTDIYLYTSNNPNQAVSGTFSYALSSGCPIIATAIPHALEVLANNTGIIVDFNNSEQLSKAINELLSNNQQREELSLNGIHKLASTAWENSALKHVKLFRESIQIPFAVNFSIPPINLQHLKKITTDFGIIQLSKINKPDINSGYTLDDNARALLVMGMMFEKSRQFEHLYLIDIYLNFIEFCQQNNGCFLNYVNKNKEFTVENEECNLEDSNGKAIWALGYIISLKPILPIKMTAKAEEILTKTLPNIKSIHSTRSMAFIIKGLSFALQYKHNNEIQQTIQLLADRIYQMYLHESSPKWNWFESYLTYANSLLPEAMLYAWKSTQKDRFKKVAIVSFQFLLSQTFTSTGIHVISNKNWLNKNNYIPCNLIGGEQPIDVAYTILSLISFNNEFNSPYYKEKIKIAFDWFQGRNYLNEIVYNPCTGGCYDGLEDCYVNLNQGAESTLSFLIARIAIAKQDFSIN